MPKQEAPLNHLNSFLPPGTYRAVEEYLRFYDIHLTVTQHRKSILGDYRHRTQFSNHRISVNGSLNKYAFLITLLHEIAHLLTFEKYGNKVVAHGHEWKTIYGSLLKQFVENRIFPSDIETELLSSLKNPAASSCAEDDLIRVLRKYDVNTNGYKLVEEIPPNSFFKLDDGKIFKKGEKQRKRFKCEEVRTGKVYLFSPVYEVEMVTQN
ncbi:MAG TPA: SprT-like domain-containing protein [Chitinophagaceae bacterium]|nr:SprT-like domain-containing protein [Chitinophagaceae bacterium]